MILGIHRSKSLLFEKEEELNTSNEIGISNCEPIEEEKVESPKLLKCKTTDSG